MFKFLDFLSFPPHLLSLSSLLAVALDDFSVIVFDYDTKKIVRKMSNAAFMSGCAAKIMDMSFSPNGKKTGFSFYLLSQYKTVLIQRKRYRRNLRALVAYGSSNCHATG